jgi:hypothetical protein
MSICYSLEAGRKIAVVYKLRQMKATYAIVLACMQGACAYLIRVIVRIITIKCHFIVVTAIICSRPHALLSMVLTV